MLDAKLSARNAKDAISGLMRSLDDEEARELLIDLAWLRGWRAVLPSPYAKGILLGFLGTLRDGEAMKLVREMLAVSSGDPPGTWGESNAR